MSKIVYTYGVFDLLHPGHVILLERAKALGDFLVVGIVADEPVRKLKGKDRPVMSQKDRLELIKALRCVDAVIEQPEYDPSEIILNSPWKIDILAKGDDWEYIPGTEAIESIGGKLVKLPYTKEYSTTAMVKKVRNG